MAHPLDSLEPYATDTLREWERAVLSGNRSDATDLRWGDLLDWERAWLLDRRRIAARVQHLVPEFPTADPEGRGPISSGMDGVLRESFTLTDHRGRSGVWFIDEVMMGRDPARRHWSANAVWDLAHRLPSLRTRYGIRYLVLDAVAASEQDFLSDCSSRQFQDYLCRRYRLTTGSSKWIWEMGILLDACRRDNLEVVGLGADEEYDSIPFAEWKSVFERMIAPNSTFVGYTYSEECFFGVNAQIGPPGGFDAYWVHSDSREAGSDPEPRGSREGSMPADGEVWYQIEENGDRIGYCWRQTTFGYRPTPPENEPELAR